MFRGQVSLLDAENLTTSAEEVFLDFRLAVTSVILAEDILVTGTAQEGIRVWHPATLTLLASGRLDNEMKVRLTSIYYAIHDNA